MQLHHMFTTVVAAASLMVASAELVTIGGFTGNVVEVSEQETQLLTKALADDALYSATLTSRACFASIDSIASQVVSGTKYRFSVKGCKTATGKAGAGKCAGENANCKAEPMVIIVFDQPWTETLQVVSIEKDTDVKKEENETAKSAAGGGSDAGSADGKDKDTPVLVATTDGSSGSNGSASKLVESATVKPAGNATTKSPAPTSSVPNVPSPAPKSSAATVVMTSAVTVIAAGIAVLAHAL